MTLELAKELWDAGFPFKRRGENLAVSCLCNEPVCDGPFGREFRFDDKLYPEPTLSELIEACGDSFLILHRTDSNKWTIDAKEAPLGFDDNEYATPEEAVGRLFVDLCQTK